MVTSISGDTCLIYHSCGQEKNKDLTFFYIKIFLKFYFLYMVQCFNLLYSINSANAIRLTYAYGKVLNTLLYYFQPMCQYSIMILGFEMLYSIPSIPHLHVSYLYYILPFSYIQIPEAFQGLIDTVEKTMKHAIEEEEGVPLSSVTNFEEVIFKLFICTCIFFRAIENVVKLITLFCYYYIDTKRNQIVTVF